VSTTWKACERAIARFLGGHRISNHALGMQTPDVETDTYHIEVKHRKALPKWLIGALDQSVANASDGKLPLVVLHEAGRRHDDDLAVIRLSDLREWFGS